MKVMYRAPYKKGMHQRIIDAWQKQYPWRSINTDKITIFAKKFIQEVSEKEKQEYLLHYREYEFYFYVTNPDTIFEYFEFFEVEHESQTFQFMHLYDLIVSIVLDWLSGYEHEGRLSGSYRQVSPPLEAYKDVPYFQMGDRSKPIDYPRIIDGGDLPHNSFQSSDICEVFYLDHNWKLSSVKVHSYVNDKKEKFKELVGDKFQHYFGQKK
ncbi:MAG: hypothetical protein KBD26_01055 [Candidatus Pacebacteria bacterium]|nr:hypothetical protein [Candidatus Paceibacterota bacterium]MBP9772400.1 hypothetical protein [Candidatus Paceibacterota bacterium]